MSAPTAPRSVTQRRTRPVLPVAPSPPSCDPIEVARFLREQPPSIIPPRSAPRAERGLLAFAVLGYRVIR